MATPKKPLAAWIVAQRESQDPPWKSEELARRLGVADSTVRGWEAGRSVSEANLDRLERLFGVTAPGRDESGSQDALITALAAQTDAINALVEELRLSRAEQVAATEVAFQALGALGGRLGLEGTPNGSEHEAPANTGR